MPRSFGATQRYNLTSGVELILRCSRATRAPATSVSDFAAFVREELPVSYSRMSPFFQIQQRTARYLATRDVETLSLQESFSLGQTAALRVYPAARWVGSSRDLLGSVAWLGYTLAGRHWATGASSAAPTSKKPIMRAMKVRRRVPRVSFRRVGDLRGWCSTRRWCRRTKITFEPQAGAWRRHAAAWLT